MKIYSKITYQKVIDLYYSFLLQFDTINHINEINKKHNIYNKYSVSIEIKNIKSMNYKSLFDYYQDLMEFKEEYYNKNEGN